MSAPTGNGADGASERAHVKPCCSPRLALQIRSFAVFMSRSTNAFYPFLSAAGTPTSWTTTETFRIPLLAVCSSTSGRLPCLSVMSVCPSVCLPLPVCLLVTTRSAGGIVTRGDTHCESSNTKTKTRIIGGGRDFLQLDGSFDYKAMFEVPVTFSGRTSNV